MMTQTTTAAACFVPARRTAARVALPARIVSQATVALSHAMDLRDQGKTAFAVDACCDLVRELRVMLPVVAEAGFDPKLLRAISDLSAMIEMNFAPPWDRCPGAAEAAEATELTALLLSYYASL